MGCSLEEDGRDKGGAVWTVLGEGREGERGDPCGFHHQAEDSIPFSLTTLGASDFISAPCLKG